MITPAARFIQVDLEIESAESLAPVCEAFAEAGVFELHHSLTERGYFAGFELTTIGGGPPEGTEDEPADFISGFCTLISGFSPEARANWDGAFRRTFDIGYECSGGEGAFESGLSPANLAEMAALGISLSVTIYPFPAAPQILIS